MKTEEVSVDFMVLQAMSNIAGNYIKKVLNSNESLTHVSAHRDNHLRLSIGIRTNHGEYFSDVFADSEDLRDIVDNALGEIRSRYPGQQSKEESEGTGTFDYITYDQESMDRQLKFKKDFIEIEKQINMIGNSGSSARARSLAKTRLEECYMWVGKAIRDEQILRNGNFDLQESRKDG